MAHCDYPWDKEAREKKLGNSPLCRSFPTICELVYFPEPFSRCFLTFYLEFFAVLSRKRAQLSSYYHINSELSLQFQKNISAGYDKIGWEGSGIQLRCGVLAQQVHGPEFDPQQPQNRLGVILLGILCLSDTTVFVQFFTIAWEKKFISLLQLLLMLLL